MGVKRRPSEVLNRQVFFKVFLTIYLCLFNKKGFFFVLLLFFFFCAVNLTMISGTT